MTGAAAEPAVPALSIGGHERERLWPSIVACFVFLVYFVWAGMSYDPRLSNIWATREGWSVLSPGLAHQGIGCAFVLAALTRLAMRTVGPVSSKIHWQVLGMILLLAVAGAVRWFVFRTWQPFSLEPAVLEARRFTAAEGGQRGLALAADLVTAALLMAILWARKVPGGYWLAALFALHPAVLSQGAGNGTWVSLTLPAIVFFAGMSPRLKPNVVTALSTIAGALCLWRVAHRAFEASAARPFNGFFAQSLEMLGVGSGARVIVLIAICFIGVVVTLLAARQSRWDVARTCVHLFTLAALTSPYVFPEDLLPLIALLPLAWTAAGWTLGGTVLSVYLVVFTWEKGTPWQLPFWIACVSYVPVWVMEIDELLMAGSRSPSSR